CDEPTVTSCPSWRRPVGGMVRGYTEPGCTTPARLGAAPPQNTCVNHRNENAAGRQRCRDAGPTGILRQKHPPSIGQGMLLLSCGERENAQRRSEAPHP